MKKEELILLIKEGEGLKPPKFEDMGSFFKIIPYRAQGVKELNNVNVYEKVSGKITQEPQKKNHIRTTQETDFDTSQVLLELISVKPKITQSEMAQKLNLSFEGVKYYIKKLRLAKKIEHVGSTKKGYWKFVE